MSLYLGSSNAAADLIAGKSRLQTSAHELADLYLKPMIGELKFVPKYAGQVVGLTAINGYLVPDDTFSGWTWADGSQFQRKYFPSAYSVFKSGSTDTFAVPLVDGFVCGASIGNESHATKNSCVKHQHLISKDGNLGGQITIDDGFAFVSTKKNGNGGITNTDINGISTKVPQIHHGSFKTSYYPLPLDVTLKMKDFKFLFGNLATDYQGDDSNVFSPASQRLATMIYIGKKGE